MSGWPGGAQTSTAAAAGRAAACALFVAAVVVANQSAIHWRENAADDHLYAYSGWRIWQGDRPYLEVWDNKPPGIWWANALGFAVCGEGVGGELLICSIALATSILAFVGAARKAYGCGLLVPALLAAGVLLTHVRYECGGNRTETFVTAFECLAVFGYVGWLRSGRLSWLTLAGLAAGTAPWFKQSGVAAGAAGALHLLAITLRGRLGGPARSGPAARYARALFVYFGTLLLVPAIVATVLTVQGALGAAWFALVTFNRYFFQVEDASWIVTPAALRRYWPEIVPLTALYVVVAIGVVWAAGRWLLRPFAEPAPGKRALDRHARPAGETAGFVGVGVFWLWLVIAFYLACVGSGRLAYHLAPSLSPLGLLTLYPLARLLDGRGFAAVATGQPSRVAALVAYVGLLGGVAGDSITHARRCWRVKPTWYALHRREPAAWELQAAAIREWTARDELVYVWGWSPGTYRFAYRRCPSRFATIEHVSHVAPYGEFIVEGAIRDVQRSPPAMFVISEVDYLGLDPPAGSPLAAWLTREYELRATIAGMHMFVRRADERGHTRGPSRAATDRRPRRLNTVCRAR